ncbi:unnamed protein product [Oikopleura dioica]|uniref:Uncharacterized protein n=1 Tax=Oikopleura dioica TaxID=34765 RepID=E4YNL9_OIKDI|nr:unnamed protein product [Oikopleura dioica]
MKLGRSYEPRARSPELMTVQGYIDSSMPPPGFRRIEIIASDEDFDSDEEDCEEQIEEVSSAELGRGPVRASSSGTPKVNKERKRPPRAGGVIIERTLTSAADGQPESSSREQNIAEVDWLQPPPQSTEVYPEGEKAKTKSLAHLTGTRLMADLVMKLMVKPVRSFLEAGPTMTAMDDAFTDILTVYDFTHRLFLPHMADTMTSATRKIMAGCLENAQSHNYVLGEEDLGAILTLANAMTGAMLGMVRTVTCTIRPTRPLLRLLGHWDTYKTCLERIKVHGVDLDFLSDKIIPAFDLVYLEQLVSEDARQMLHSMVSRLDVTPVAPFLRNELSSLTRSGFKWVFAMKVINPNRQVRVNLTTREQSWVILDYRLQAARYRLDPTKFLPPKRNNGGVLMSEMPIHSRPEKDSNSSRTNKAARKTKKRAITESPLVAKKRGRSSCRPEGPTMDTTAPPKEKSAKDSTALRSFLVNFQGKPEGDDFTVSELQGVVGVDMAIRVSRAVQIHLDRLNVELQPNNDDIPPLEDVNLPNAENEHHDVELPPNNDDIPPIENVILPDADNEDLGHNGADEIPLPNPAFPVRRSKGPPNNSGTESESETGIVEQEEQTDESSEHTSDLTTDSEEGPDRSFQPNMESESESESGSEEEEGSTDGSTESERTTTSSPRERPVSRRNSRRSKANARKRRSGAGAKKQKSRKASSTPSPRQAEEKRATVKTTVTGPKQKTDGQAPGPIFISSSSGSDEETVPGAAITEKRPDHVGEFRDYVGRTRHNANRTPNRGRRRMKLQGVTLLADSVTLREHTAASDEEILPERYVPVRYRLWEDQNTTIPTLTLPTTEFMNAHQKALVHIIRGCETIMTALFGRQPDPAVLVAKLDEYYDQNYVKVPSLVRNLFHQAEADGSYAAKLQLYREKLPELAERDQFHLQILMVSEICSNEYKKHIIGAEEMSNNLDHGLRLIDGCDFTQTFKVLSAMSRYLLHYDHGTGAELEVVNELMLRVVPGFACQAPVVLMRGGVHVASCTDSRCLLGSACLRKSSSLVAIFLEPIEIAGFVGYRLSNAAARSIIRPVSENKHNPGFNKEFIRPFESAGISTMDSNAMLYGLPQPLIARGMPDQILSYIHPLFPVPGVYLRIVFLKERKDPRHPNYSDYCKKVGSVIALLRAFDCEAELLPGSGDVLIDASSYDEQLTTLLHAYTTEIRLFASVALERPVQPVLPLFYPKIDLPAVLATPTIPQMKSNMTQTDRQELYLQLQEHLARSTIVEEYNAFSERQRRAAELRGLLKDKNPFELHLTAKESRARLEQVLDDLHQPGNPLTGYAAEIFPPSLSEPVTGKCHVPYCHRESCGENEAKWAQLLLHVRTFAAQELEWQEFAEHTGPNCRAFFPMPELERIEKEVSRPLQQPGRPKHPEYQEPAITGFLSEKGYSIDELVPILSKRARRVFGLYRHPGNNGRMSMYPDVYVPSAWLVTDGDFSCFVSLRVALPSSLSRRYMSLTPLNVRPEDLHHLRDGARNRGRMSF